ncbi:MAG: hypothetical protein HWD62_02070 [Cyclobacteriaceae bacterium]|nr:MAG: hypothetical protein HWD62_02070 [Cyclobacteriaceae bacterium]
MEKTTSTLLSSIKDNHKRGTVGEFLRNNIKTDSDLSIVSAYFTIYAYNQHYNTHANRASNKPAELPVDRLNAISANLIGQPLLHPLTEESFNKHTKFEDVWTIHELLEKCDNQKRDNWFMRIFRK